VQAFNASNTVTGLGYLSDFFARSSSRKRLNIASNSVADLIRADREFRHGVLLSSC
jgi:hypothetical protein